MNKQLWGVAPRPPGLIGLAFAAVFLGGIVIGSTLFGRGPSAAIDALNDVTGSITKSAAHIAAAPFRLDRPETIPCGRCAP